MRPSRGPYARSDRQTPWFLPSAGTVLVLLVLTVPAYIIFPDIFPGAMMWLLAAIAVLILAWTVSRESRAHLQPHQVKANLGMVVTLAAFIIALAVKAPVWITWAINTAAIACGLVGMYRRSD